MRLRTTLRPRRRRPGEDVVGLVELVQVEVVGDEPRGDDVAAGEQAKQGWRQVRVDQPGRDGDETSARMAISASMWRLIFLAIWEWRVSLMERPSRARTSGAGWPLVDSGCAVAG